MIYPTIADLMKKTGTRYGLVIAAAKRARQIAEEDDNDSAPSSGAKCITQAAREIADDLVVIEPPKADRIAAEEAAVIEEIQKAEDA